MRVDFVVGCCVTAEVEICVKRVADFFIKSESVIRFFQ